MAIRYTITLFAIWLITGCGGGGSPTVHQPSIQDTAIQKISQYAQSHGTATPPTIQDYLNAGVTGIDTQDELDKVNEAVSQLTADDVDTDKEIQEIADRLGVTIGPSNSIPTVDAGHDQVLDADTVASLSCSGEDSDGSIVAYHWIYEGDTISEMQHFTTEELTQGVYTYTCEVTDNSGAKAQDTLTITVNEQHRIQSKVRKTGQITSYDTKDDGYYQAGADTKYTRDDGTDIVTDHLTMLMWQDDEDVETNVARWITEDNYNLCKADENASACFDTSGELTAVTYCAALRLGGYQDWRVPTIKELRSIVVYTPSIPAIDPSFKHMAENISWTARHYWSSTPVANHNLAAWPVSFQSGYVRFRTKNMPHHVRCVRNQ